MGRGGIRSYRLLAQILPSQLSLTGPEVGEVAAQASREWGRFLVDPPPLLQHLTGAEATDRLIALLATWTSHRNRRAAPGA
jgi:hypothetical protein